LGPDFSPIQVYAMIKFFDTPSRLRLRHRGAGFTLVEMMVSIVILVILMTIIFQIMQLTSSAYKQTTQGTGTMQQARVAFERMTRTLSQATLNTYYSYFYSGTQISSYLRQSELQFVSGYGPVAGASGSTFITTSGQNAKQVTHAVFFQAPLGVVASSNAAAYGNLGNLLNACGYFVMYGPDTSRPNFLSSSGFVNAPPSENRFRLMEYVQPSEYLNIYTTGSILSTATSVPTWITNGLPTDLTAASPANVRPLASNIVALIIMPEQFSNTTSTNGQANTIPTNSPNIAGFIAVPPTPTTVAAYDTYNYDSAYKAQTRVTSTPSGTTIQFPTGNQLPPLVKVIMVAIDEASGARLAAKYPTASSTAPPDLGNLITSSSALFQKPTHLHSAGGTTGDLELLQATLNSLKANYYVFQTDVVIRGAKWTVN